MTFLDPTTQKTAALLRRAASEFRSLASGRLPFDQEDRAEFTAMANELAVRAHRIEVEWQALGTKTFSASRRDALRFVDLPPGTKPIGETPARDALVDVRTPDGWRLVIKIRLSDRHARAFYDAEITDPSGRVTYTCISWPSIGAIFESTETFLGVGRDLPAVARQLRELALAEMDAR